MGVVTRRSIIGNLQNSLNAMTMYRLVGVPSEQDAHEPYASQGDRV